MSETPRTGKVVPTFTMPDLLIQLRSESMEVQYSRSANETLKRVWRDFTPLQILVAPDNEESWVHTELYGYASFQEVMQVLESVDGLLKKGFKPEGSQKNSGPVGSGRMKHIKQDIKRLLLHHAYQRSWEFSAFVELVGVRRRLPLGLMEHRGFVLDNEWHSARFGSLNFHNLHVHRHDLRDGGNEAGDLQLSQELSPILKASHFREAIKNAPLDSLDRLTRVSVELIEKNGFLSSSPTAINSEMVGTIYTQPYQDGPKKRGPKDNSGLIVEIFLELAGAHLKAVKLNKAILDFQGTWAERFEPESAPPPHYTTIRGHLMKFGFWVDNAWDIEAILAAKSKQSGHF